MTGLRTRITAIAIAAVGSIGLVPAGAGAMSSAPTANGSTTAAAAQSARAWTDGVCTDPTGVTVVIDFQELGGGVHVRCAPQPIGSGFDALKQAGIDYTTTVRFPGFICKIAGKPDNDPCQTASPATAYWSYWIAPRGGNWCYSNWGAGNRTPPPGSVEAWSFSFNRSASTSPTPRFPVPGALPGAAASLAGNDCDPSSTAPKPTTPPPGPAPTTPPAPVAPPSQGGGASGGATVGGAAVPGPGAPDATGGIAPAGPGVAAANGSIDAADAVDPDAAPPAPTVGEAPAEGEPEAGDDAGAAGESSSEAAEEEVAGTVAFADTEAASVDLSGDGRDKGSPLGLILAVVLVAALGGGAFIVNRRRVSVDEQ